MQPQSPTDAQTESERLLASLRDAIERFDSNNAKLLNLTDRLRQRVISLCGHQPPRSADLSDPHGGPVAPTPTPPPTMFSLLVANIEVANRTCSHQRAIMDDVEELIAWLEANLPPSFPQQ